MAAWEGRGTYRTLGAFRTFTVDVASTGPETLEPLLVVHGFPSSSFDYHRVVDAMAEHRRVLLFDMIGYGLSAKPDRAYTIDLQADVAEAFVADTGVSTLALLTHDLGDTVGGELLARQAEGRWPVEITRRVITNGSIYIEMAHLSPGQLLLLSLPDERLPDTAGIDGPSMQASLAATFSAHSRAEDSDLAGEWELISHDQGHLLLPRTIRYIEERRRNQVRFTGAIESHPSPLAIVWGTDDPIAVRDMATRLHGVRPDASLTWLEDIGHYPMLEAPSAFLDAVGPVLA
ncbi:MAG TPA: alpha/beta hydrolase [Acidimicrobiales bacterium]|nr:alpha/beta hydrolase [Acidimicrobiales bacterium]